MARIPRRHRRRCGREKLCRVRQTCEQLDTRLRSDGQSEKSLHQRDESAGEVAAVDGRHVPRMERGQRRRVVPVQEVSLVTLQPLECRQHPIEALDADVVWI